MQQKDNWNMLNSARWKNYPSERYRVSSVAQFKEGKGPLPKNQKVPLTKARQNEQGDSIMQHNCTVPSAGEDQCDAVSSHQSFLLSSALIKRVDKLGRASTLVHIYVVKIGCWILNEVEMYDGDTLGKGNDRKWSATQPHQQSCYLEQFWLLQFYRFIGYEALMDHPRMHEEKTSLVDGKRSLTILDFNWF